MFARLGPILLIISSMLVAQPVSPRFITTGVDAPTPAQFRRYLADYEKWGFDGTVIQPTRRLADGKIVAASYAFSGEHWDFAEFAAAIEDLRQSVPRTARTNFLRVHANPGNVDWFDDAGWTEIVDHWRLLARVARESGLTGLVYDPEPYTPPWRQFDYQAQPQKAAHSFAAYAAKARSRGRDIMHAIAEEYPGITIFSYQLLSGVLPAVSSSGSAEVVLAHELYGLLPAFLNGWLDALPPAATLVDGNERSYRYNDSSSFSAAYAAIKIDAQQLISMENWGKFCSQYKVAHAIYLDAYCNPPDSAWYIDPLGHSVSSRLAANAASALTSSDGYVWIYGENARWWPSGPPDYPLWTEKLPHVVDALQLARDPVGTARQRIGQATSSDNRLIDGSFIKPIDGALAPGWKFWQIKESPGTYVSGGGSAVANLTLEGCFLQDVAVKPGDTYMFRVKVKSHGSGFAGVKVRWQKGNRGWVEDEHEALFVPHAVVGGDRWQECTSVIHVPDADKLVLLLVIRNQHTAADTIEFSDAMLVLAEGH